MGAKYLRIICTIFGIYIAGYSECTRVRREDRTCAEKFSKLKQHSACATRSPNVITANSGVNDADMQYIVREHNKYRGMVSPNASNMAKMSWDAEVAMVAQHWAETCSFSHDDPNYRRIPGRFSVGQNIGQGYKSWTEVMKAWYDENSAFNYNQDNNQLGQVGHYTQAWYENSAFHNNQDINQLGQMGHYAQLVWAKSTKVGCGMADCGSAIFHVCNYAPGGNVGGVKLPYKSGTTCGDCAQSCQNKLCDCGGLVCENDATFNMDSCTCTCKYPSFQVNQQCQLDCSNVTEPYQCAQKSYVGDCTGAYNVPLECPNSCDVCPHGAYNYRSNESGSRGHSLQQYLIFIFIVDFCYYSFI